MGFRFKTPGLGTPSLGTPGMAYAGYMLVNGFPSTCKDFLQVCIIIIT